jgi:hypothetical protein
MTAPISPDDLGELERIAENTFVYGMDRGFTSRSIANHIAIAVARAVCPPGSVVVSRDDLEDVVSIADEVDVYIDRRLAALDRMWELLRKEQG